MPTRFRICKTDSKSMHPHCIPSSIVARPSSLVPCPSSLLASLPLHSLHPCPPSSPLLPPLTHILPPRYNHTPVPPPRLPVAHTCFAELVMPVYTSPEQVRVSLRNRPLPLPPSRPPSRAPSLSPCLPDLPLWSLYPSRTDTPRHLPSPMAARSWSRPSQWPSPSLAASSASLDLECVWGWAGGWVGGGCVHICMCINICML